MTTGRSSVLQAEAVSPDFSSLVVARRRKRRPGKACDRGRHSRTLTVRQGGRPSITGDLEMVLPQGDYSPR